MNRILVVSNRLPVTVNKTDGKIRIDQSSGGLVTGLQSLHKSHEVLWVGWPGISTNKVKNIQKELGKELEKKYLYPIYLSDADVRYYYNGFSNGTIWPLFHYFPLKSESRMEWWNRYVKVNELFADEIVKIYKKTDIIWVHDYHLMLLPGLLRERLPRAAIGFFLHIPFPSYEIFRLLPWRKQVLDGLIGADLIAFHTHEYMAHFLDNINLLCGYESIFGRISMENRVVRVDALPMGIDYEKFSSTSSSKQVTDIVSSYKSRYKEQCVILSVDRLDYTKGIVQRLEAFKHFLGKYPQFRAKIVFVLLVVPSRTKVEHYANLKRQIDEIIGEINGKYSTLDWSPVQYIYRSIPFDSLVALYRMADIALITPRRDGMNLVAKEFIASKADQKGVLILSETAGAAKELGEAIIVNPNSLDDVSQAILDAFNMSEEEQISRNNIIQNRLIQNNISKWASEFLAKLIETKKEQKKIQFKVLKKEDKQRLIDDFRKSKKRLMLLDYDGTLTSFRDTPELAKPDREIIQILIELAADPRNEVVLISGRDRKSLEAWFGELNINLVAEHGAWTRRKDLGWQNVIQTRSEWKTPVFSLLETWVSRIPGSFIEVKDYSIVWHYRKVDPRLNELRIRDIIIELLSITPNLGLQILKGKKVIEVKDRHINKGMVASTWQKITASDFILAMGDDFTDEDMFSALSSNTWTIKVGPGTSKANYSIKSPREVKIMLKELIKSMADKSI
jgi:trehalose 6-phosphate synthase/phosphatase